MKPNTQPIEKVEHNDDGVVSVHSIWKTIQGEGPFAGTPAIFVRLAGCNLRCVGCDTDYTTGRRSMSPMEIVNSAYLLTDKTARLMVLTGGEPFRQNIKPLIEHAVAMGFAVQIETNGTLYHPIPLKNVTIVVSPKSARLAGGLPIHAFKYVVEAGHIDPEDGLPNRVLGKDIKVARPPQAFFGDIFIQPMDVQDPAENKRHVQAAVGTCLQHGYRLCLQMHKIVGLE